MFFFSLVASITIFLLGGIVLFANRKKLQNIVFSIFSFALAGWVFSISALTHLTPSLLIGRFAIAISIVWITALVFFSHIFPENKTPSRKESAFILVPAAFFFIAAFTEYMVREVSIVNGSIHGVFGPVRPFYIFFPVAYITNALYTLFQKYRHLSGIKRLQIMYFFLGVVAAFAPALITNIILPGFGIYHLNTIGPVFSVCIVAFTSYAIIRHRLMDIRVVIQRGIIYTALLSIIIALYLLLLYILESFFQKTADLGPMVSAGITTLVGVFGVPPIERYFRKLTDPIFFKHPYNYAHALHELSEILNHTLTLDSIFTKTAHTLTHIFKPTMVAFSAVGDTHRTNPSSVILNIGEDLSFDTVAILKKYRPIIVVNMPGADPVEATSREVSEACESMRMLGVRHNMEIMAPIVDGQLFLLLLGKKRSGDPYTSEDLRLIKTFANQASTSIKKAELYQKVKEYSNELEERVEKRTAQIKEMQEEQRRMMMDISHNLQTPLTIIKSELGSLERTIPDNTTLRTFERSLDKISKFIYDLLELARLEHRSDAISREPIHLSEILEGMVEYFTVLTREKHIRLTSSIEAGIIIDGDKKKIEDLIVNLVSNAVKYMPEDSKRKHIGLTLTCDESTATLVVEDTGIGMSDEEMTHIFDRFYRSQNQEKRVIQGTGLGLAITKRIVDRHGGTIDLHSEAGKGTAFTVTLPLHNKTDA